VPETDTVLLRDLVPNGDKQRNRCGDRCVNRTHAEGDRAALRTIYRAGLRFVSSRSRVGSQARAAS